MKMFLIFITLCRRGLHWIGGHLTTWVNDNPSSEKKVNKGN